MTTIEHQPAQPIARDWEWQLFAACRGQDVEIFYHPAGERRRYKAARIQRAKQVCQDCPVINDCRSWALATREPYGVWGGLSEDERATILGVRNLRYPHPAGSASDRPRPGPQPDQARTSRPTSPAAASPSR